ncbi:hypothetical protein Tco_0509298 [Tanacetum coccineum]
MEERLINGWIIIPRDFDEVKTKLKEARTQILELQKKHMGQRDKIAFVCFKKGSTQRLSDIHRKSQESQEAEIKRSIEALKPRDLISRRTSDIRPFRPGNPQQDLDEKGVIDSGCSRHMTGNMSYLTDFKEINEGHVAFGGNSKRGKITGRGRKSHFLEDQQIPSVGVFNIWKAFGGNTRDLGSFGEETDKTMDLHQHLSRLCSQRLETASQDTRDAVTTHPTTVSQEIMTASARTTQPKI